MTTPFIIYALPRSRTAWLSAFLTYRDWTCHHDQSITMRTFKDVRRFFERPKVGTVETAAAPGWRLIQATAPNIRTVVIHRPVKEVIQSLNAVAIYDQDKLQKAMSRIARSLDVISAQPGVLSLDYSDLESEEGCKAVFEHCLPHPFDWWRWETVRNQNIQIDVAAQIIYCINNREALSKFKSDCWRALRAWRMTGELA